VPHGEVEGAVDAIHRADGLAASDLQDLRHRARSLLGRDYARKKSIERVVNLITGVRG
jgi:hypothetical protein